MKKQHYDGDRLRALREQRGLSKSEVAQQLGMSRWTVIRAENEGGVSYQALCAMAALYGVPIVSLLHPAPPQTPAAA